MYNCVGLSVLNARSLPIAESSLLELEGRTAEPDDAVPFALHSPFILPHAQTDSAVQPDSTLFTPPVQPRNLKPPDTPMPMS